MLARILPVFAVLASVSLIQPLSSAQTAPRDYTSFQTAAPYSPELDIQSDMAMVYGVDGTFADRVRQWRDQGYTVGMMTGISWGGYEDYYQTETGFKTEEVQTAKSGRLYMHGDSKTVGYNVPTQPYVDYIKEKAAAAVDAGVSAVFMEEPEYWAETGWSEAFKREWEAFYGEPWQAPDSSVDAQWRASLLKYELYFGALEQVFEHVKARAEEKGIIVECHVPTHSLINYAHWRIVSPESRLMDLEAMDGYIAQVWTGTARTPNTYQGVTKERTFETAFLEYGQMLGMVRPTGRKVWFLADPIEDNPNYSWNNYRYNYECTIVAALMWPEVHHYEVMPWPSRIFRGQYPKVDLDTKSGDREGIPADYATELLTVINALNGMDQDDVVYDTGTRGIGVIVSDTMMFQRARPHPSDPALGSFYGLALPLLKHGVPVEVVQLENTPHPGALAPYKLLLLTYEGQKPMRPEYHEALAAWVRGGGCLLYVGDGDDPYHRVRAWWNADGTTGAKAYDDLFERLGIGVTARNEPVQVGEGWVRVFAERPRKLQKYDYGANKIRELCKELLAKVGEDLATQHYLKIRRGPYIIASVLDESVSDDPVTLRGQFVDLFDPQLPCITEKTLAPNERTLLYDLEWARGHGVQVKVVAAAARIRGERLEDGVFHFTTRGPVGTTARVRALLPGEPASVRARPDIPFEQAWDADSGTLLLTFDNQAKEIDFAVHF